MKAHPILFSAPMVRALLDGRKTQTRRVVKPQPVKLTKTHLPLPLHPDDWGWSTGSGAIFTVSNKATGPNGWNQHCPYGQPGDLLWVRETFFSDDDNPSIYKADGDEELYIKIHDLLCKNLPWKPSIHMPRRASRLTLELTGVRVERLQDINHADAMAEGVQEITFRPDDGWPLCVGYLNGLPQNNTWSEPAKVTAKEAYTEVWESINGSGSWVANPWVWVLEFKVHRCNVDELLKARRA